jgi:hypothetical protein
LIRWKAASCSVVSFGTSRLSYRLRDRSQSDCSVSPGSMMPEVFCFFMRASSTTFMTMSGLSMMKSPKLALDTLVVLGEGARGELLPDELEALLDAEKALVLGPGAPVDQLLRSRPIRVHARHSSNTQRVQLRLLSGLLPCHVLRWRVQRHGRVPSLVA